jgi:hypothetical protein
VRHSDLAFLHRASICYAESLLDRLDCGAALLRQRVHDSTQAGTWSGPARKQLVMNVPISGWPALRNAFGFRGAGKRRGSWRAASSPNATNRTGTPAGRRTGRGSSSVHASGAPGHLADASVKRRAGKPKPASASASGHLVNSPRQLRESVGKGRSRPKDGSVEALLAFSERVWSTLRNRDEES